MSACLDAATKFNYQHPCQIQHQIGYWNVNIEAAIRKYRQKSSL